MDSIYPNWVLFGPNRILFITLFLDVFGSFHAVPNWGLFSFPNWILFLIGFFSLIGFFLAINYIFIIYLYLLSNAPITSALY